MWPLLYGDPVTLEELTDDEVEDLAVEHLALLILARVAGSSDLLFGNFIYSQDLVERSYGAKSALAEAWQWLERKGLLGPNVGQATGWQSITRAGRKVVEEGEPALARLRAAERLDVDLHPSLELLARPQFLMGSYEMAVLEAFKAVEVRLRQLSASPAGLTAVRMAQRAFGKNGPLRDTDPSVPDAEKDGGHSLVFRSVRGSPESAESPVCQLRLCCGSLGGGHARQLAHASARPRPISTRHKDRRRRVGLI